MIPCSGRTLVFLFLLLALTLCRVQIGWCEAPETINVRRLYDNRAAHNHKSVEVTGFISLGFERLGLCDPSHESSPYVWLEGRGKIKSGTQYFCGVSDEAQQEFTSILHIRERFLTAVDPSPATPRENLAKAPDGHHVFMGIASICAFLVGILGFGIPLSIKLSSKLCARQSGARSFRWGYFGALAASVWLAFGLLYILQLPFNPPASWSRAILVGAC